MEYIKKITVEPEGHVIHHEDNLTYKTGNTMQCTLSMGGNLIFNVGDSHRGDRCDDKGICPRFV